MVKTFDSSKPPLTHRSSVSRKDSPNKDSVKRTSYAASAGMDKYNPLTARKNSGESKGIHIPTSFRSNDSMPFDVALSTMGSGARKNWNKNVP